ncbi:Molybdenum cofactor sulfurase [Macrophomina phaseolina MS6]|uniref:Molybdenum cofactor sulfurase n=1 Tax=Macrophomina phaseolina (strain MS6) TaxID=1126212 RepID=K2QJL1_MACPH|nr:Molybdenum cofactor sulfurase [Macrophomina phaseolina MS6]
MADAKPLVAGASALPILLSVLIVVLPTAYFLLRYLGSRVGEKSLGLPPPPPPPDEIVSLRIYPIKSCRGIEVKSAKLLRTGLDLDRNWMFISLPKREFITIRTNSKMTLIDTAIDASTDELIVSIKGHDHRIAIPAHPTRAWLEKNAQLLKATIWSEDTDGWEYSADLTQPFSEFFGMDVRLVYKGPTPRILRGSGDPSLLGRTESTKFADMMPVLVSSMASMAELNSRLRKLGEEEITIERFRPNIVVRGHEAWNEDSWKTLQINSGEKGGTLVLDVVCRCLRCQVPNVNPDTAEKHARQPWNELMTYRRIDEGLKFKPSFGMLCAPRDEGLVEIGMRLEVTKTTNNHFFLSPMK